MIRHHRSNRQALPEFSLFDWADERERTCAQSFAATIIQKRYRMKPRQARLVAELSGLGDGA